MRLVKKSVRVGKTRRNYLRIIYKAVKRRLEKIALKALKNLQKLGGVSSTIHNI